MNAATLSAYGGLAHAWCARHWGRIKQGLLIGAAFLFFGGLYVAFQAQPDVLRRIAPGPLLVILLLALPAGMAINAVDFQLLAKLSGVTVGFWRAFEIVIFTRAANMLPVPGSFAVRIAALSAKGASLRKSGSLMLMLACLWGGIGFCFSSIWLFVQGALQFSVLFAAIGLSILAAIAVVAYRARLAWRAVMAAAGLRLLFIALEAFILMMAVRAVGVVAGYDQTAILVVASFLSSIVPAGLGVRETIIAALSPLAGIDPATGFLAAAAARFAAMLLLAVCALAALAAQRLRDKT
ncbi:MAG: hypothetical protein ACX939_09115 [Hyphococcus sp.]